VLGLQACTTKCGLKDTVQPKYTSAVVEKPSTTFFFLGTAEHRVHIPALPGREEEEREMKVRYGGVCNASTQEAEGGGLG
jgi:hypothetical protein